MSPLFLLASLFSSLLLLLHRVSMAGPIAVEFLYPNFTASNLLFVDNNGVFLTSPNGFFQASMYNPMNQQSSFYLSILHSPTSTLLWSANRATPTSNSGLVKLTPAGLTVSEPNGTVLWSTPNFSTPVAAARLLDTGNLQLLDKSNSSLWQSFEHPTDTIVSSQLLRAGSYLSSSITNTNLAEGDYNLSVTTANAKLTWLGQSYWRLSNDVRSIMNSNQPVSAMVLNTTGLYLLSSDNTIVFMVPLTQSDFRVMKLGSDGRLTIKSYASVNSSSTLSGDFTAPSSDCDLPYICNSLGLCTSSGNSSTCTCPPLFAAAENQSCVPGDGSTLASSYTCSNNPDPGVSVSYLSLRNGIGYFSTKFMSATISGENISTCHSSCSKNCSCTAYFYDNSSLSCYLLEDNPFGSLFSSSSANTQNAIGYVKTLVGSVPPSTATSSSSSSSRHTVSVVLPCIAAALLIAVILYMYFGRWKKKERKKKTFGKSKSGTKNIQLGQHRLYSRDSGYTDQEEDSTDDVIIPGMPTRFTYEELEAITNNFETKIGAGGFGAVYKGELPDNSLVAVKKIEGVGVHGRKEFCTEIAVIGNIRHVNLVRLRGFCAQGSKRLLVYEYMNRGSLDRPLFSHVGPVLEWGERVEIALGTARALAYLHSGCEHKIVHCDVKPENILLADGGQVKISDFGLAKLLAPEQSALFTTMRGTRGYLAPEWLTNAAISDRADVYSFGMVLLELVRGRKNRSERSGPTQSDISDNSSQVARIEYFPMLALEKHEERRYADLADPRLEGRVSEEEVGRFVRIALTCLHEESALRPNMATVVRMLEGTLEAWEPQVRLLNFLKMYGRGFAEPCSGLGLGLGPNFDGGSVTGTSSSTVGVSWSPSYMSSQQVSGPR